MVVENVYILQHTVVLGRGDSCLFPSLSVKYEFMTLMKSIQRGDSHPRGVHVGAGGTHDLGVTCRGHQEGSRRDYKVS